MGTLYVQQLIRREFVCLVVNWNSIKQLIYFDIASAIGSSFFFVKSPCVTFGTYCSDSTGRYRNLPGTYRYFSASRILQMYDGWSNQLNYRILRSRYIISYGDPISYLTESLHLMSPSRSFTNTTIHKMMHISKMLQMVVYTMLLKSSGAAINGLPFTIIIYSEL